MASVDKVRLASVIVNNYNYGHFVQEAIDSALDQSYPLTEVIVVDDGSTDQSREIIARYRDRIIPVFKENGGQASAFNAGFRASHGHVIAFLDADDALFPNVIENAVHLMNTSVANVRWQLLVVDGQGKHTGRIVPPQLTSGCFRDAVIERGPDSYGVSPTTGNAWNRAFLEKVLPIRESDFRICADKYLFSLAPLFGYTKSIAEPLAYYRMHGKNNYFCSEFEDRIKVELLNFERSSTALALYCQKLGISVNPDAWKRHSWWHRVHQSILEIATLIPEGYSFILVDEDQWASTPIVAGRRRVPFPENEGQYWGPPPNDSTAIRELERLRHADAPFIVVAWPAFWWLEHYAGLHRHLRSTYRCILENDRLVVFDRRL